jgi:hypothetical protein
MIRKCYRGSVTAIESQRTMWRNDKTGISVVCQNTRRDGPVNNYGDFVASTKVGKEPLEAGTCRSKRKGMECSAF